MWDMICPLNAEIIITTSMIMYWRPSPSASMFSMWLFKRTQYNVTRAKRNRIERIWERGRSNDTQICACYVTRHKTSEKGRQTTSNRCFETNGGTFNRRKLVRRDQGRNVQNCLERCFAPASKVRCNCSFMTMLVVRTLRASWRTEWVWSLSHYLANSRGFRREQTNLVWK